MDSVDDWPPAPVLTTDRLLLEPLRVDHAEEMAPLLDDPRLHVFTGGQPPTLEELRDGYEQHLTGRSAEGGRWLNWVVRLKADGRAVGGLEATVMHRADVWVAELAWIIASEYQRRGYAREAATAMSTWLRQQGTPVLIADIHRDHEASTAVARALGLSPSGPGSHDEDLRWRG